MIDNGRLGDLSDVIGRIYDAAVDPAVWPEVLGLLCQAFTAAAGTLNYHELVERRALIAAEYGTNAHYSKLYLERYSAMNPLIVGALCHDVGAAFRIRDIVDLAELEESRFYKEWIQPQGYGDLISLVIHRDDRHLGILALVRLASVAAYDEADVEAFTLVGDHVRRAVRISGLFRQQKIAVALFETVLSQLTVAIILINDSGQVVFVNTAGQRILRDCRVGRIVGGRLSLTSVPTRDLLDGVANSRAFVAALPQRGTDGTALGLTAFALRGGLEQACDVPIAIFISGEQTVHKPPPALLAAMYDLTGGELRVLLSLLGGKTPGRIADQLGISITTVRTHLARVFAKTESSGQIDLMRKLAGILPPFSDV